MMQRPKTSEPGHDHDICPACSAELCGGLIVETMTRWLPRGPEDTTTPRTEAEWVAYIEDCYRGGKCYSRTIGVETRGYDGVSYWRYPCCGAEFSRWTGERVAGIPA